MWLETKKAQWGMLLFLSFIWGSSFILMKKGLESYDNYQVAAFRIFFSFVLLIPIIVFKLKKITKKNLKALLIVGFVGNAFPALLFTTAQLKISSSLAGMLNSLTPLFTMIIGIIIYKSKIKKINIIGVFIGLIGAWGLVAGDLSEIAGTINSYALLIALANICYGFNINVVKNDLQELDGVSVAALGFLFTGPFAGAYLWYSDFSLLELNHIEQVNLFYVFLLALFSSVIAVIGINILIKHTTAVFASSVTYIIPVFAIMWGIFDGESVSIIQILAIAITLFGVYLVNKK